MPMHKASVCRCYDNGLRDDMTFDEVLQFIKDRKVCSDPMFLCSSVSKVLREAELIRDRRAQYEKRVKKAGGDPTQSPTRTRNVKEREIVEFNF